MIGFDEELGESLSENLGGGLAGIFCEARKSLSGKRIALLGSSAAATSELARVIAEADGFTRFLSPRQVDPSSEILKPFELMLVDIEAAAETAWLDPEKLAGIQERCIAIGPYSKVLHLVGAPAAAFREYWPCSSSPEEVLLRCILGLRAGPAGTRRNLPTGSTVVLADDDASVTAIVRRALERNGLSCEIAATGNDALALITKAKPCAAVLDVHMPTIDGFEVLSRMKSIAELAQTRVILLTGCEDESDVIRGFSLGADDYVCKPFNPMELTIRLMRVIGRI